MEEPCPKNHVEEHDSLASLPSLPPAALAPSSVTQVELAELGGLAPVCKKKPAKAKTPATPGFHALTAAWTLPLDEGGKIGFLPPNWGRFSKTVKRVCDMAINLGWEEEVIPSYVIEVHDWKVNDLKNDFWRKNPFGLEQVEKYMQLWYEKVKKPQLARAAQDAAAWDALPPVESFYIDRSVDPYPNARRMTNEEYLGKFE